MGTVAAQMLYLGRLHLLPLLSPSSRPVTGHRFVKRLPQPFQSSVFRTKEIMKRVAESLQQVFFHHHMISPPLPPKPLDESGPIRDAAHRLHEPSIGIAPLTGKSIIVQSLMPSISSCVKGVCMVVLREHPRRRGIDIYPRRVAAPHVWFRRAVHPRTARRID